MGRKIPLSQLLAKLQQTLPWLKKNPSPNILQSSSKSCLSAGCSRHKPASLEWDRVAWPCWTHTAQPRRCCPGRNAPQNSPKPDSSSWPLLQLGWVCAVGCERRRISPRGLTGWGDAFIHASYSRAAQLFLTGKGSRGAEHQRLLRTEAGERQPCGWLSRWVDGSSAGRVRDGIQALLSNSVSHTLGLGLSLKRSETPSCGKLGGLGGTREGREAHPKQLVFTWMIVSS